VGCELYTYQGILCARELGKGVIHGNLLFFENLNYIGKISFKDKLTDETDFTVYNDNDSILAEDHVTGDDTIICYKNGIVQLKEDEEELEVLEEQYDQKQVETFQGTQFKIKGFRQKLIFTNRSGDETILVTESWKDTLLYWNVPFDVLFLAWFLKLIGLRKKLGYGNFIRKKNLW
jgi:hypothetical protein